MNHLNEMNQCHKIIETHCHLDYLKQDSLENIIKAAKDVGVEKIMTISVDPLNLQKVLDIAESHVDVYCTQGIHPHDAKDFNPEVKKIIIENLQSSSIKHKILAVGEIGLDYYYLHTPREQQIDVFEQQLQLAIDFNLPVVIHTRDADADTLAILKNFSSQMKRKGVVHSFTSSWQLAEYAISENFKLGFNGIITFKSAQNVQEIVMKTPLENILLETDAPFLTPVPHRGKENAPLYLPFIAKKIAELKVLSLDEVIERTYQNASETFSF